MTGRRTGGEGEPVGALAAAAGAMGDAFAHPDRAGETVELLTVALDAVQEIIAVCAATRDASGAFVGAEVRYANRFARDRWIGPGTPLEAVVGRDIYEVAPHTAVLFDHHRRVVETGEPFMGVVAVPHASGERWIDLHLARIDDGFAVTSRDVTETELERQAAQANEERYRQALAASEERFRRALDATLDTLAILRAIRDDEGRIEDFEVVYANRAWQEVYGQPGRDPVGHRLYAEFPFFAPRRDLHVRAVETGEPIRQTLEVEGPPRAFYEFQLTKFGDGYVTASRNVTDRVLIGESLAASEERLRDLVSGVDAIVTLDDEATGLAFISPQAERILGYPPERLADPGFWRSLVHPDDVAWVYPIWDQDPADDEIEYRMVAADGRVVWLRERTTRQVDPDRGLDRWFGVAVDITQRKVLEDQLERSRRMESLGRLASGIAHDFNNVLYGISILASYLVRDLDDGPRREDARQILDAVERGSGLTRQLLAFSRGGSGRVERTNVASVVSGVASMLELLFGGAISVETESAAGIPEVVTDRHALEEALVNLATNARDAMPDGGRLTMHTDEVTLDGEAALTLDVEPGRYVRLTVADTGGGVAPEIAARIFEPFATTKPVETGTGLGLSNVYSFVRAVGGAIDFESQPGVGTTFTIHLPTAG